MDAPPLPALVSRVRRRSELAFYARFCLALFLTTRRQWAAVREHLDHLDSHSKRWPPVHDDGILHLMRLYVEGAYHQGRGDLAKALELYRDHHFSLDGKPPSRPRLDMCLLATLNRIWILQHPSHRDPQAQAELVARIRPLCVQHPDREMQILLGVALVTIRDPQTTQQTIKATIGSSIKLSQATGNTLNSAILLCVLHAFMFGGQVSSQALKSAQAASSQSQRAGSALWMSVADRLLAQSYDVHGDGAQALEYRTRSMRYAEEVVGTWARRD